MNNRKLALIHFILKKKIVDEPTGCWFVKNCRDKNKYQSGSFDNHKTTLPRLSAAAFLNFDLHNDLKLEICHKCDIKACFNPDHLYVGTHGSNKRDYFTRQARISEDHCIHGHLYNLNSKGKKVCLECQTVYKPRMKDRAIAVYERWQKKQSDLVN